MLPSLVQLFTPRPPTGSVGYDLAFVRDVNVESRPPRDRRTEGVMVASWILIGFKCWFVIWAIHQYNVPLNPLWINAPTVIFALLCTAAYIWRR